jgi:hypothetical protein
MDFDTVSDNRINTYNWTEQIPTLEDINKIIDGIHDHVPSKQRKVRFKIAVIPGHSVPELQLAMYRGTCADMDDIRPRYNPQVLAPWVLAFAPRWTDRTVSDNYFNYEIGTEIGLAAMYSSLAAANMGMAAGFCACIQNRDEMAPLIGFKPKLYLGIGYRDPALEYYCPVYNSMEYIPDSDFDTKPCKDQYITYV